MIHIINNTETTEEGTVPHTRCHSGFFKSLAERNHYGELIKEHTDHAFF